MSGSKVISDNCHVLELALWTNAYQENFLGRVFSVLFVIQEKSTGAVLFIGQKVS